jgi:hypothetical protein
MTPGFEKRFEFDYMEYKLKTFYNLQARTICKQKK